MRRRKLLGMLAGMAMLIAAAVTLAIKNGSGYWGVGFADVEVEIRVVDDETDEPLPGAEVRMHVDDYKSPPENVTIPLDEQGRGRYFHKCCMFEDHVQGGGLLSTSINLGWSQIVAVDAGGHQELITYLEATRPVSQVYSKEDQRFHVVFEPFRLRKADGPGQRILLPGESILPAHHAKAPL
jgi:hypothetical protein